MPFSQTRYLGASIRGINATMGWNENQSQVTVNLVEDTVNGDSFTNDPNLIGSPTSIVLEGFTFNGLIQRINKSLNFSGNPVYDVTIVDPREILSGIPVIIGGYNGITSFVPNLINAYGFWESTGYGNSLSNNTGMPWTLVKSAVETITNLPAYGSYGGSINFRGYNYAIDLSQIPFLPEIYRVSGPNQYLSEIIGGVCRDLGCDYFVTLELLPIKKIVIHTVSRVTQPSLGTSSITTFVQTLRDAGVLASGASGYELRNEVVAKFLVGAQVETLYRADADDISYEDWFPRKVLHYEGGEMPDLGGGTSTYGIANTEEFLNIEPFFGFDQNGQPILRIDDNTTETATFPLNAGTISDIIGSVSYYCTIVEMRFALANKRSWEIFIFKYRPLLAAFLGLTPDTLPLGQINGIINGNPIANDFKAANMQVANNIAAAFNSNIEMRRQRVYELVRDTAQQYLYKKFAIRLPFILSRVDPESGKVETSYDVSNSGFYAGYPDGLSRGQAEMFLDSNDKYTCFLKYPGDDESLELIDTTLIDADSMMQTDDHLFVKAYADKLMSCTNRGSEAIPYVVVTANNPIIRRALDVTGDIDTVGAILGIIQAQAKKVITAVANGIINIKVHPGGVMPDVAFVPLKSNILAYGPWYHIPEDPLNPGNFMCGKIEYRQDTSLAPWNYSGSTDLMNAAAALLVQSQATTMQVSESGDVEFAGAPTLSIGDDLVAAGPQVTNISINYGIDGVKTNYRMETYTQKYGQFSKLMTEKFNRLAQNQQQFRKDFFNKNQDAFVKGFNYNKTHIEQMQRAQGHFKGESTYQFLIGFNSQADPDDEAEDMEYRPCVSIGDSDEALKQLGMANDANRFDSAVIAPFNSLIRPYNANIYADSNQGLAYFTLNAYGVIGSTNLNPFQMQAGGGSNDIEHYVHDGTSVVNGLLFLYDKDGELVTPPTSGDGRGFALRGPVVISGWGYNTNGFPVPNSDEVDEDATTFLGGYLRKSHKWKTGPLDVLWDKNRGVWTCHDVAYGIADGDIDPLTTGTVDLYDGDQPIGDPMTVYNPFTSTIEDNVRVVIGYVANSNEWVIIGTDSALDNSNPTVDPISSIDDPADPNNPDYDPPPDNSIVPTPGADGPTYWFDGDTYYNITNPSCISVASLSGWWPFNNAATDAGGTNNGTATGATYSSTVPALLNGQYDYSSYMAGNSQYITLAAAAVIANQAAFSVAAWIKMGSGAAGVNFNTIYQEVNASNQGLLFRINSSGNIILTIHRGSNEYSVSTTGTIALNQWYHVAATLSGTTVTIYVNGVASGSGTVAGTSDKTITSVKAGPAHGDMYIADLRVYSAALTNANTTSLTWGDMGVCGLTTVVEVVTSVTCEGDEIVYDTVNMYFANGKLWRVS